jgi:hypothetical protein
MNVFAAAIGKTLVLDLRFGSDGQPPATYAQNPFWIDEFSISRTT